MAIIDGCLPDVFTSIDKPIKNSMNSFKHLTKDEEIIKFYAQKIINKALEKDVFDNKNYKSNIIDKSLMRDLANISGKDIYNIIPSRTIAIEEAPTLREWALKILGFTVKPRVTYLPIPREDVMTAFRAQGLPDVEIAKLVRDLKVKGFTDSELVDLAHQLPQSEGNKLAFEQLKTAASNDSPLQITAANQLLLDL